VILDGFPRTINQLDRYNKLYDTTLCLNIKLREDILMEKLMGLFYLLITFLSRRTCVNCGTSFNLVGIYKDGYDMEPLKPKKEGICDICGGKLITRPDDTKEVVI